MLAVSVALTAATAAGLPPVGPTAVAAALVLGIVYRDTVLQWRSLLALLLLVILFVPIRRYVLPGHLPFQLEPYRILVGLVLLAWGTSLMIDRRVRIRATGYEAPLALFLGAVFASIVLNGKHITAGSVDANVAKSLSFLLSFVLVVYVIASLVRTRDDVVFLVKLLVAGGAVISFLAVVESRTQYNPFNHLGVLPGLKWNAGVDLPERVGKFRAFGPAEHPIALSAMLAMIAPLAGYLGYTLKRRVWWIALGLIVMGCLATVSRTGVLILVAEAALMFALKPREMRRTLPALLPLLLVVHLALPGTLGTLRQSFFPQGGLIQEQQGYRDLGRFGKARLAPTFAQIHAEPLFGIGFGTRITGRGPDVNAYTLDDQWLGTVLEIGIVGAFAWLWLLVRVVRRLGSAAKRDDGDDGWLYAALGAALTGYAVSMITYDAFSFVQVTFVFFILLGLAVPLTAVARSRVPSVSRVPDAVAAGRFGAGTAILALALVLFVFYDAPSVRILVVVLAMLTLGATLIEKSRTPPERLAVAPPPIA